MLMKFLIRGNSTGMRYRQYGVAGTAVVLAFLLSGCAGSESTVQNDPELARLERAMVNAVNRYRILKGLNPLMADERVAGQARLHSRNMAADNVPLAHDGADERTVKIGEMIQWKSISENVAFSTQREDLIDFVLDRWIESPGHLKNIEGEYNMTGIGLALSPDGRYFFTQIFVLTE